MNSGLIEIDKVSSVELSHLAKFHLRLKFSEGRKETQEDSITQNEKVYRFIQRLGQKQTSYRYEGKSSHSNQPETIFLP